ncbi:hypothetical protein DPMN_109222 [Dreissena polymorpha]|uniref:Uncharacterized protein n=1 Tax=Dreissena polymorpha TaxID=45954 RepID=A0A9D4KAC7_DREPO|nr:hypothetical protein DPMN_109222 [Dreissena polymorpha]
MPSESVRIVNLIKDDIVKYSTRRMRKEFFDMCQKVTIASVILRYLYRYRTNSVFGAQETEEIDEWFEKFLFEAEDCELIYEMRKENRGYVIQNMMHFGKPFSN